MLRYYFNAFFLCTSDVGSYKNSSKDSFSSTEDPKDEIVTNGYKKGEDNVGFQNEP